MLPGPPRELRPMFDEYVVPLMKREFAAEIFVCRTLRSTGIGESRVQEMVEADLQPLVARGLEIGYCARPGAVDVRLTAGGAGAEKIVREGEAVVQRILGANIFGFDDEEIENVVVRLLTEKKKRWRWRNPAPAAALPTASRMCPARRQFFSAAW